MSTPRVTIGVPVWNGERHLESCLDSLVSQTYHDIEIVISDNASTDRTPEICRDYCERDDRVTYHRQATNIGAAANYNLLVHHARGELFQWAAHDDVFAPEFVQRCVEALDASPSDVLAFPRAAFIDDTDAALETYDEKYDGPMCWSNEASPCGRLRDLLIGDLILGDYRATLLLKCTPQYGVMRRAVLERTRIMGNFGSSDVVLLVELALRGGFAQVDEFLFFSRVHEGSATHANPTPADLARWYDPLRGERFPMPWTQVLVGLVGAVRLAPLSPRDKARALTLVGRWFVAHRRWRVIGGELKLRARELLAGSRRRGDAAR